MSPRDIALTLMALMAAVVVFARKLVHAVIGLSLFSTILTLQYLWLHAPDVAMTEAALGAGLSTIVFLVALQRAGGNSDG
ncbi:MAG: DUF4040 domain-containing protein [Kiritimatiellae bacterium]|nr:DUF4040 domain-containing protein [Kiritimatiellia bacterium]